MARTVLPIIGGVVGAFFGVPQLGILVGSVIGNAVDPVKNVGPKIGETGAQKSAEGAARAIVFGTAHVTGNVIVAGALIKGDFEEGGKGGPVNVTERGFRTYAVRICEGVIGGVLRIWENDKLVVDYRTGSTMVAESDKWMFGCGIYYGTEDQLPDSFLTINTFEDNPAYRGTAYMVFVFRDLTDFRGAIPQYRFEVAREVNSGVLGPENEGPRSEPYPAFNTYLSVDDEEYPFMLRQQTGSNGFEVSAPGSFSIDTFPNGFELGSPYVSTVWDNSENGPVADKRIWPIAFETRTNRALAYHANHGYCMLMNGGYYMVGLKPTSGASDTWWYGESLYAPEYGGLAWFYDNVLYLGVRQVSSGIYNQIFRFALNGTAVATAISPVIMPTTTVHFWMHVSRTGVVRAVAGSSAGVVQQFDADLVATTTFNVPSAIASRFPSSGALMAFGVDDERGWQAYLYSSLGLKLSVYDMAGTLLQTYALSGSTGVVTNRIIFTSDSIYIQNEKKTFRIDAPDTFSGLPMLLGDIVSDIHSRCGIDAGEYDVSELTDEVAGLVLAGDYTGADAINTLRGPYFFDKAEYDQKLWYPKRGASVVDTLTVDDLIDEPDTQMREQAVEYPRKLHLFYQHAASGYAVVKATSQRSSPDVLVVGEVTAQVPVTFVGAEDEAAQTAAKMHKVTWAEAEGEVKFSIPWSFLSLVPSNNIGMSIRGRVNRLRITQLDLHDGVIDVTARHDRQSAYTSNVTGIPIPDPTPPPSTIVGDTTLLVLDIPSLRDTEDDLNIYYAVNGTQPGWYGAAVQRSLDGANWETVTTITRSARMGELTVAVADASASGTDTTNTVNVRLYREDRTLESISEEAFLSEQNAFALENADGSWEIMQARDWNQDSSGDWVGSRLHRGRLNTTTNAHAIGRRFVMLEDVTHVPTQSSMIGQTVYHRAPSLSQAPEEAAEQSMVYTGASQLEWPPASLVLARDPSTNVVTGSWAPRYRFGTDDAPVNSINMTGYRITIVGSSTVVLPDQSANSFSYDASALGASVTVSVQTLNRITGAGPATSGTI